MKVLWVNIWYKFHFNPSACNYPNLVRLTQVTAMLIRTWSEPSSILECNKEYKLAQPWSEGLDFIHGAMLPTCISSCDSPLLATAPPTRLLTTTPATSAPPTWLVSHSTLWMLSASPWVSPPPRGLYVGGVEGKVSADRRLCRLVVASSGAFKKSASLCSHTWSRSIWKTKVFNNMAGILERLLILSSD